MTLVVRSSEYERVHDGDPSPRASGLSEVEAVEVKERLSVMRLGTR